MASKENLAKAKKEKNDEFYTQLSDIENELKHYKDQFRDKIVFCNCDDPEWSNFWKYFELCFEHLGLKKLVSTHYEESKPSYKLELEKVNGELIKTKTPLLQNGDFRSPECIEILKECDIVVTNPPFSLFREYVAQLIEYDKDFLIIGHQNAITYKNIFPLIKEGKLWLGYGFNGGATHFINRHYEDYATSGDHRDGMIRVSGVHWFTNLDHNKRHEKAILYKSIDDIEYKKYINYDAINVDSSKDIPDNYYDKIGVPITFLDKLSPDQFNIVGLNPNHIETEDVKIFDKNGKEIKTKGFLYFVSNKETDYKDEFDNYISKPYARLIIERNDMMAKLVEDIKYNKYNKSNKYKKDITAIYRNVKFVIIINDKENFDIYADDRIIVKNIKTNYINYDSLDMLKDEIKEQLEHAEYENFAILIKYYMDLYIVSKNIDIEKYFSNHNIVKLENTAYVSEYIILERDVSSLIETDILEEERKKLLINKIKELKNQIKEVKNG